MDKRNGTHALKETERLDGQYGVVQVLRSHLNSHLVLHPLQMTILPLPASAATLSVSSSAPTSRARVDIGQCF